MRKNDETKKNILNKAIEMFSTKGVKSVRVDDIVASLGLTRGAFYHYFDSREALIHEVVDLLFYGDGPLEIKDMPNGLNGLEIFRYILATLLVANNNPVMQEAIAELYQAKEAFKYHYEYSLTVVAPEFEKLVLAGNADGSMNVLYPHEFAEVFTYMLNMWLLPQGKEVDDGFYERLDFMQNATKQLGADIIDQNVKNVLIGIYKEAKEMTKK